MQKRVLERLKEVTDGTIEEGPKFEGSLKGLDYYNLMCRGAAENSRMEIKGSNLYTFNYVFEGNDAVLFLFSIPLANKPGGKHVVERVLDIVKAVEDTFITLDYMHSKEVKEDNFVYLTCVKVID